MEAKGAISSPQAYRRSPRTYGPGISYNRSIFRFRIDHILHSADMKAYSATVDTRIRLSDHYPVWCILKLESQN